MSLHVLLIGSGDRQLESVVKAAGIRTTVMTDDRAARSGQTGDHDLILFDLRGQAQLPPTLSAVRRQQAHTPLIVVADRLDASFVLDAMRAGVNECLADPVTQPDLEAAIARVMTRATPHKAGRIYAFLGAKGGVGTTTLAVNVATALARLDPGNVLFADLHFGYGDSAVFLGAEPRFSVVDALENAHRMDASLLKGLVTQLKWGLDLLPASDRLSVGPSNVASLPALIEWTAGHYGHVVLDVPRSDGGIIDTLGPATEIIVVANQELATLKAAMRLAGTLRQRFGKERVEVVVSRYDSRAPWSDEDVERALGAPVRTVFPSNYRVALEALNTGRPLVLENHNSLASAVDGFARRLAGIAREERTTRGVGLFGRLTGKRAG